MLNLEVYGVRGGRKAACCAPRFFREGHYTQYIIAFAYIYIYIFLALYIYIYMFKRPRTYVNCLWMSIQVMLGKN